MTLTLVAALLMLWFSIVRGVLVQAKVLQPTCTRCGLRFERKTLGERVCTCDH